MGVDFSKKIIVAHPTIYHLGQLIGVVGLLALTLSVVTLFAGDFIMPALFWGAMGLPVTVVGGILVWCAVFKA